MCDFGISAGLIAAGLSIAATATTTTMQVQQQKAVKKQAQAQNQFEKANLATDLAQQREAAAAKIEDTQIAGEAMRGQVQASGLQGGTLAAVARQVYGSTAKDVARIGKNYDYARVAAQRGQKASDLQLAANLSTLESKGGIIAGGSLSGLGTGISSGVGVYSALKMEE